MRLGLAFAIVCACAAPAVAPKPPGVIPSAATPATPSSPSMIAAQGPLRAMREAPPSGAIDILAATPDGSAAITADEGGGVRLWPTLDGSREPRVVTLESPIELALARAGSGFIAASIDEGHDLTLTMLDADGRTLAHRGLGGDPAVTGVAAFDGGLVAWSSDQKITLFGTDGATRGTLGTQPGERVVAIATGGSHVVVEVAVMHDATPHLRVRALVTDPTIAWGDFIDAAHEPSGPIALSSSGKRLAMIEGDRLVVLDLARSTQLTVQKALATALAFADDTHVAALNGLVQWYEETGLVPTFAAVDGHSVPATMIATAPGRVVALSDGALVLATSQKLEYLGYTIATPSVVEPGGSGSLMVVSGSNAALLDSELRSHRTIALAGVTASSVAWLGGDDWFAVGGTLRVVSTLGSARLAVDAHPSNALVVHYEPSTQLATTSLGESSAVYRWDPRQVTMTAVATSPRTTPYEMVQIVPTAPAQARGVKLVRITVRDHATVEWFTDEEMKVRVAISEVAAVLATDRAGRIYAWTRGPKPHVAILATGAEVGQLALAKAGGAFPDATGDRVAVVHRNTVELFAGGKLAWSQDVATVWSVAWLSDGALAVVTTAGIERLDPATGAVAARRCGWGFGLSTTAPPPMTQLEPMCAR